FHSFQPFARIIVQPSRFPSKHLQGFRDIAAIANYFDKFGAREKLAQLRDNRDIPWSLVAPTRLALALKMLQINPLDNVPHRRALSPGYVAAKLVRIQVQITPAIVFGDRSDCPIDFMWRERSFDLQEVG